MMDTVWPVLQSLQGLPAYALTLGLLFGCGIGLPMNEDIVLLAAAALTLQGIMDPIPLMGVAWIGLLAGDALIFHWGYRYGAQLLRRKFFARMLPEARLQSMQATMTHYGPAYIFVVRFLPGIRTPLFLVAGMSRMPYRHLFVYDGLAAAVELPLLVYGVRYVGGRWREILASMQQLQDFLLPAAVLAVLALWLYRRRVTKGNSV
ncbi:MAG TPA: DedA family protein [Rhodoferax sp.]|jgi:membrane protein DedA with SNARE-associated domain|nr:DedA family protein [Rhodoferax sp.]HPW83742.1 DedA family protein [Rhodoferax sp.]HQC86818.1 DedA family protein [Rhodoferax sp.]HQY75994.1 DedA family protein [Rhodoferax sp.]